MTSSRIGQVEQQLSGIHRSGRFQTWFESSREVFGRGISPDSSSSEDEYGVTNQSRPMIVVTPPPSDEEQMSHSSDITELSDQMTFMRLTENDGSSGADTSTSEDGPAPDRTTILRSALRRRRGVRNLRVHFERNTIWQNRIRRLRRWWHSVKLWRWCSVVLFLWVELSIAWVVWQISVGLGDGRNGFYVLKNIWRSLLVWLDDLILGWVLLWKEARCELVSSIKWVDR
jgi:hypothetical protein